MNQLLLYRSTTYLVLGTLPRMRPSIPVTESGAGHRALVFCYQSSIYTHNAPANYLCFSPVPIYICLLPTLMSDPNLYLSPFYLPSRKSDICAISPAEEIGNYSSFRWPEYSMFIGIFYLRSLLCRVKFGGLPNQTMYGA